MEFSGAYRLSPEPPTPDEGGFRRLAARYLGQPPEAIEADDLTAFSSARRHLCTCSYSDLRGFSALCDNLSPDELRDLLDQCLAGITDSIDAVAGLVDTIDGNGVLAGFGAHRRVADHALRAIQAALRQQAVLRRIRSRWRSLGHRVPAGGIAVNTDELVIGPIGPERHRRYSILGEGVDLTTRICNLAQPDELLCTEATVAAVLTELPSGWHQEQHHEEPLPLDAFSAVTGTIHPLPDEIAGQVVVITHGRDQTIRFRWLYTIDLPGHAERLPIVAIEGQAAQELALDDRAIVSEAVLERRLGRYRLLERIGKGGMGEVWRGLDPAGKTVAIKTLLAGDQASEDDLERFRREAEVMSRLDHPHICRLYDIGEHGNTAYIAMEYIDGVSLADILAGLDATRRTPTDLPALAGEIQAEQGASRVGGESARGDRSDPRRHQLGTEQTLAIVEAVADATRHAHEQGVLHRDLKATNIMVDLNGRVVVMDFGLAKLRDDRGPELSLTGQFMGTLTNMAPEQAASAKDVDERADVYALGTVLYECLCGCSHFAVTDNLAENIARLQRHSAPTVRRLRPDVHPDLSLICATALANHPADRYQSMRQFQDDLGRFRRGDVIHAVSPSLVLRLRRWTHRNPAVARTAAIAMVLLVIGAAVAFWNLDQRRRQAEDAQHLAENARIQAENTLAALRQTQAERDRYEAENAAFAADLEAEWTTVYHDDFSNPDDLDSHWLLLPEGLERSHDADGLTVATNRGAFLVFRHPIAGSLRISFDATILGGSLDDISCFMGVPTTRLDQTTVSRRPLPIEGYEFKIGGYNNTRNLIKRQGAFLRSQLDNPLQPGVTYHVVAERRGERLRLWLDDRLILDLIDRDPITDPQAGLFGLSTWFATVRWSNVQIERLGLPRKVDILSLAADLELRGDIDAAHQVYQRARELAMDSTTMQRAKVGIDRTKAMLELRELAPRYTDTLRAAWPGHGISVVYRNGELRCHLEHIPIDDLTPLAGMQLQRLFLEANGTLDLSPLAGMPLVELTCAGNGVTDIEALRGMPLQVLDLDSNQITSIEPLVGMPLEDLSLMDNAISRIDALRSLPLRSLLLNNNRIEDLEPLRDSPLILCNVSGNRISDLTPLTSCGNLSMLSALHNRITSCSGLDALPLSALRLSHNPLTSLGPINGSELITCNLEQTRISDISPLAGSALLFLNLSQTPVSDLSPLAGLPLTRLELDGCPVSDLGPLRSLSLSELSLRDTAVSSLDPLDQQAIERLSIAGSPVTSLTPLNIAALRRLNVQNTPLDDAALEILAARATPLTLFALGSHISPKLLRRLAGIWQDNAATAGLLQAQAAIIDGRHDLLPTLAQTLPDGRRVLQLPILLPAKQVDAYCRQVGGSLIRPTANAELSLIREHVVFSGASAWVAFEDGSPALFAPRGQLILGFDRDDTLAAPLSVWPAALP